MTHPFEDPTPTTWDWLESVGWELGFHDRLRNGPYEIDCTYQLWVAVGTYLSKVATRGRVRMAAELFGIELKEAGE